MEFGSALRAGEPVVGGWVSIGHPAVAEITASLDFEFVTIDTEHAAVGIDGVENLVRAVDAAEGSSAPIVRVPSSDPVAIKRVLDTGTEGILVPRVEDADEARSVVEASTYPPEGIRGTAAGRAAEYGLSFGEYLETADEELVRIVQVETEGAVAEAGEIAAVEGVDALFVGPADLSAALDCHLDYDTDPFREAVESVTTAARENETAVGIFVTDPDRMETWLSMGFDFAIVGFDAQYLVEGNRKLVDAFDSSFGGGD